MNKLFVLLTVLFFLSNCTSEPALQNNDTETGTSALEVNPDQLNISILLDLSDRLIRDLSPTQDVRDIEIIESIVEVFRSEMDNKGAFKSKGKIRILMNPPPKDPNINNITKKLNVDLSTMNNKNKKLVYDNIRNDFSSSLRIIYDMTLESKNWIGSDIWRFFKNDVDDLCIESSKEYRNILVIITDGYIYHEQSIERVKNRTAYVTMNYLAKENFRNNSSWQNKFDDGDYGLISTRDDLENLEVLVLEVNASDKHKDDDDIIKAYLGKWFDEMNIKDYAINNTNLPENTKIRLDKFFK